GAASTVTEHATVDVWMAWKNLTANTVNGVGPGGLFESYTLPSVVMKALQGSRLMRSGSGAPPTTVYATLVRNAGPRLLEQDENIVHVPIAVEVWRAA